MGQVSVTISGRQYRMACDDGQEEEVARLGRDLDQRIADLRKTFGEIGDMRLTIMAAIMLAEESSAMSLSLRRARAELAELQQAHALADRVAEIASIDLAATVNDAAERIEKAAKALGQGAGEERTVLG
jgi:cell division protein ZapA